MSVLAPELDAALHDAFGASGSDICITLYALAHWPLADDDQDVKAGPVELVVQHVLDSTIPTGAPASSTPLPCSPAHRRAWSPPTGNPGTSAAGAGACPSSPYRCSPTGSEIRRHVDTFFADRGSKLCYASRLQRKVDDLAPHVDAVATALGMPSRADSYELAAAFVTRNPVPAAFVTGPFPFASLPKLFGLLTV